MMRFSVLVLSFIFLSACVAIPETGENVFMLTSPAQEAQLGDDGYKDVLAKEKINKDPRLNAILQRVGKAVAQEANQPDFKWQFTLIESDQVNAWCMPGGKVAFYTGIIPYLRSEAGMAVVMGHEVAHAVLRHSGQRISKHMQAETVLGLLSGSLSSSPHHNQIMGLFGVGTTVGFLLPHSRKHESQADVIGLRYMARAGYDPQEAVRFWKRFSKAGGGAPPEFLSTHPAGSSRIQELQKQMTEALAIYQKSARKLGLGETL